MDSPRQSVSPFLPARIDRLLLMGGLLLAFALRLHRLGGESLWYDETVSVFLARQSIPDLIAHTARDIHPPGYYLLLHLWGVLTQPTLYTGLEFLYTWPSLLWGTALLPLIYALGRRLFSHRIGLVALLLAAVHPWHIWYSQEARMYTMGAGLGLLCLWATLAWLEGEEPARSRRGLAEAALYVIAGAAGLYTLYYFAFLLISLNILVLVRLGWQWRDAGKTPVPELRGWVVANLLLLLLWSPWLSTFWRQVTEPPVPPWRGGLDLATVTQESLSALLVGESPPGEGLWLWAGIGGLLLVGGLWAGRGRVGGQASRTLAFFVLAPLLLIVLLSLAVTPLYHIRYFFIYAAVAVLLVAAGVDYVAGHWRWLHAITLAGLIALSGVSLHALWTDPAYRADDHRGAVAALAAAWLPGDAVLVNAGWAYTALHVYWPPAPMLSGDTSAEIPEFQRLIDYTKESDASSVLPSLAPPVILVGGSVDGESSLGWGLAESDFYPMSRAETEEALATLAASHPRIWHYRIYDTVSDPDGRIREWLATHTTPLLDQPYPGRDYLRVQSFGSSAGETAEECEQFTEAQARFSSPGEGAAGDGLELRAGLVSPAPRPGAMLYTTLCLTGRESEYTPHLRASLRLYPPDNPDSQPLAQKDTPLPFDMTTRNNNAVRLGLPVPASLPPGEYRLELILYDGRNGEPLVIDDPRAVYGQRWPLDEALFIGPR